MTRRKMCECGQRLVHKRMALCDVCQEAKMQRVVEGAQAWRAEHERRMKTDPEYRKQVEREEQASRDWKEHGPTLLDLRNHFRDSGIEFPPPVPAITAGEIEALWKLHNPLSPALPVIKLVDESGG